MALDLCQWTAFYDNKLGFSDLIQFSVTFARLLVGFL